MPSNQKYYRNSVIAEICRYFCVILDSRHRRRIDFAGDFITIQDRQFEGSGIQMVGGRYYESLGFEIMFYPHAKSHDFC